VSEVARQLRLRCGFTGGPLVIGVSGGGDSLALLLASIAIRDRRAESNLDLQPITAHVHHHLRPAADDDLAHVAAMCHRFDIALHVQHIHPADEPGNLAANARRLRYEALDRVAHHVGAQHIAVGHHAEDQLETMLMALCRGAGLEGLSGMAWRRPLGDETWLLRPLLMLRKSECRAMCETAGVVWREDPTNVDLDRTRARVRNEIMPIVDILWPDACRRATGTADIITAAAQLIDERVADCFGEPSNRHWNRTELARQPLSVIAAGLRRAVLDEVGGPSDGLGQRQIMPAAEAVLDDEARPRRFLMTAGLVVIVRKHIIDVVRSNEDPEVET
jgi:tRNA(Ile)-lysidine synthetase-like protein